jgi:hypothetical protein
MGGSYLAIHHFLFVHERVTPMNPSSRSFGTRRPFGGWKAFTRLGVAILVTLSSVTSGCGADGVDPTGGTNLPHATVNSDSGEATRATVSQAGEETSARGQTGAKTSAPGQPAKAVRKIIYDARIDLVVDSLNATELAITNLIKVHDGFLAESDQSSITATQRRGTWRVRVPVDQFSAFVSAVSRLGEIRQNHVGSQDVTEEYFDIEARIRNKREEEKRLIKHLADSTGKLEDILAVEKEISRVRGEIEQMEGRLRLLANRTELSTVTIEALEWKDYKPPVAATFSTQLSRTFFHSVESLVQFGQTLLLVAVAVAPWLPFVVLGIFIVRWIVRPGRSGIPRRPPAGATSGSGKV